MGLANVAFILKFGTIKMTAEKWINSNEMRFELSEIENYKLIFVGRE